jgi:hypothetical protein
MVPVHACSVTINGFLFSSCTQCSTIADVTVISSLITDASMCCRYNTMIRYPGQTSLEDNPLLLFEGETIPFKHEDPLANFSSREEFQDTVRLMGGLSREDPLLFSERFAPLPGLPLATLEPCDIACTQLFCTFVYVCSLASLSHACSCRCVKQ